jgi:peptidyl-prolyl cis-trans isomerase A (cyclophilin A)
MRAMHRTLSIAAIALATLAACEKSKGTSEEAPIQKGSTPKPLPPPTPKVDAAVAVDAAELGGGGAGDAAPAEGLPGSTAPGATAPTPPAVGGADMDTVRAPVAADLAVYLKAVKGTGTLRAELDTSMGTFHCVLFEADTPMTVANFVGLATGQKPWINPASQATMKGTPFYNGLIFHRVISDFMVQGGDPLGQGIGGPGYQFDDEIKPNLKLDAAGILAMANAGPGTNGSQFFITEKATPWLTGRHTVFGKCDEVDLVKKITGVPKDGSDKPLTPVTIKKVTILRK